jgi:hypothetical protein
MRFLLQAVIYHTNADHEALDVDDGVKLATTSNWVRDRITSPSVDQSLNTDFVYLSCRKAALIYCKSISERTPLSYTCTLQDLNQLWASMWRITLSQWKKIPGIFIWILLSINQAAQDTPHGRLVKSLLKSASFYVALENWEAIDGSLGSFVRLQRWLRGRVVVEQMGQNVDPVMS